MHDDRFQLGEHARPFLAAQFMVAVGSIDADGAAWTSLLFGKPGFVRCADGAAIQIDAPLKERDLADPVWDNLAPGADVGLLLADFGTRQRCRVQGAVQRLDRRGIEIAVRDAGPHCAGQGARQALRELGEPRLPVQTAHGTLVRGAIERIVSRADSLYLSGRDGSVADWRGLAGLATPTGPSTLRIPQALPGRAGMCIPDFDQGLVLQLTGHVGRLDPSGAAGHSQFVVERWILRDLPRALVWDACVA